MTQQYENLFTKEEIAEIEKIIGYTFLNKALLCKSFVHSSYAKENGLESNERFEFLGDRILNFIVAEKLHSTVDGDVGVLKEELESMVSAPPLFALIEELGLFRFVKHSKKAEFEEKKKSDLFEAILAAIYLDGKSFEPCKRLVNRLKPSKDENFVGKLYEYCEKNKLSTPCVEFFGENPFECVLTVENKRFFGSGKRKITAKKEACKKACEELNI